jgi:uncharacterized protein
MTEVEIEHLAFNATQKQDYETAIGLLTPLADKDSVFALETLGWIFANGDVNLLDFERASEFLHRAIALGSLDGYLHLGWLRMREAKFADARFLFEKGRKSGGNGFEHGLEVLGLAEAEGLAREAFDREEYRDAFALLNPYSAQDSIFTLMSLGWLYDTGQGGISDKDLALSFYQRCALLGGNYSYYYIGVLEFGRGDLKAARVAFSHGAIQEHLASMSMLGEMMIAGQGGAIEVDEGISILAKCAKQGHIMARLKLLRREIHMTDGIFKKFILQIRYLGVLISSIKEVLHDRHSPKLTEFL